MLRAGGSKKNDFSFQRLIFFLMTQSPESDILNTASIELHNKNRMLNNYITVVNWNVAWRSPNGRYGKEILKRIQLCDPDIVCLTESCTSFEIPGYKCVSSASDYGYPITQGRRKVRLLSRNALIRVDEIGSPKLPPGRFVSAQTETRIGMIKVIGVCIPWKSAHVSTGRRNRTCWEDHKQYLSGLASVVKKTDEPAVLVGDFNQTIPRTRAPLEVFSAMMNSLEPGFTIVTSGEICKAHHLAIDHIALTPDLHADRVEVLSNMTDNGCQLSDHYGIVAKIMRRV